MAKHNLELEEVVREVLEKDKKREAEAKENEKQTIRYKQILDNLADLGGKVFNDDEILFQGDKLIVPENMTLSMAKQFLEKKEQELEKETSFTHIFNYRPYDGAYCMWNVMKKTFGVVGHKDRLIKTMFGTEKAPPLMIDIPIDVGKSEQVPWGRFELPFLPRTIFEVEGYRHLEKGMLFMMQVTGPKKYKFEIEGIFRLIEEELRTKSLYRGKAFDGQENPEFIDLSSVRKDQVVYSQQVMADLEANIWAQLRYTDEFVRRGIPLKRAVLVHGPFGTGKTLAALLTGQEAVENNWTFIKARPGRDNIFQVMQTAKLYEPCVVFYEDVDQIADADETDREGISMLLDVFDGIEAKNTRILCILTTNYPEKITKGMARPGRLDAMIEINELDQEGVEKLVRTRLNDDLLSPDIDWGEVFVAAQDYKPAFITELADRVLRYVIARAGTVDGATIETIDLVNSATGLRPQYDRMIGAKELGDKDRLAGIHRELAEEAARKIIREDLQSGE